MTAHDTSCAILTVALLLAASPGRLAAQQQNGEGTASQSSPSAPKPALADFAWLTGQWEGTWGPRVAQQTWTAPKARVMLGTFQLTEGDRTLVVELFTLVEDAQGIKLYLRHFTPTLNAWEESGPTTLDLQSADAKSIIFVNAADGQPKQDAITRLDADTYVSRSEIASPKGDVQATEITYHRVFGRASSAHGKAKSKKPRGSD
jgi:hypothetical protein